jgi:hypothetical protein
MRVEFNVGYPKPMTCWVTTRSGTQVSPSANPILARTMELGHLEPEARRTFDWTWDQRNKRRRHVAPGQYLVWATLEADRPLFTVRLGPAKLRIVR